MPEQQATLALLHRAGTAAGWWSLQAIRTIGHTARSGASGPDFSIAGGDQALLQLAVRFARYQAYHPTARHPTWSVWR